MLSEIPNHKAPAITEIPPPTHSALFHPRCAARMGVSAGEMSPPILLPRFITPPAVPLRDPASSIMVAQHGPSTASTDAVARVRYATAKYAFVVTAPKAKKIPAELRPSMGIALRPQRRPIDPATRRSEIYPPKGIDITESNQGRLLKLPARTKSKC